MATKFLTVGRARERHRVDLAIEQHAVDVRPAVPIDARRDGAIGGDVEHERAGLAQRVGEEIARDVRPRQQKAFALDAARRLERVDDGFGPELGRRQVDADPVACDARGGRRPDGADADALELAHVARGEQPLHEVLDPVAAREHDPVERRRVVAGAAERVGVFGRRDPDGRRRDGLGAAFFEHLDELARLLERSRDDDALAEERPFVEPAQVLSQSGDGADDEQRRHAVARAGADVAERPLDRFLRRQRAVVDERRAFLGRAAVGEEGLRDGANLTRAGEADERAAEARQPRPVDVGRRVHFALVASDERQRIAGARVGHGNAGIGEAANRRRDAGNDLERNALLVQEERLLAAAVEHERIAPLQPDDRPALAGLLGQQKTDGVLIERFRRRRSDVDQLRARLREAQQAAVHAMVEDDDVGRLEATLAAHAHERRIAGTGTNDVDTRSIHGSCQPTSNLIRGASPLGLPTRSLARRFVGALRSRGSLAVARSRGRACECPLSNLVEQLPRPVRFERRRESPAEPAGIGSRDHSSNAARRGSHRATRRRPAGRACRRARWRRRRAATDTRRRVPRREPVRPPALVLPARRARPPVPPALPRRPRGSQWQQYPDRGPERTDRLESRSRCDCRSPAGGGRRRRARAR